MKSPLAQLLFLSVVVGIGLWVGFKWFLSDTDNMSDTIDIRSVAYSPSSASSSSKSQETALSEPLSTAAFGAPEPMKTVEELSEAIEIDELVSGQGDAEELQEEQEQVFAEEDVTLEDTEVGDGEYASDDKEIGSTALSAEELDVRARARKQRLAELGLISEEPPEPTIAVDVSLLMPDECSGAQIARVPVGLKFRYESSIVRGESLNELESLVALYRDCEQGEFVLDENPLGRADANDTLTQMRFDEVKYFFLQHSVSIDAVKFPEEK